MWRHLGVRTFEAIMSETLTITDNRTNKTYEIQIRDGSISAMELRRIK